jgi:two-component system NarL family sensor kinase
MSRLLTFFFLVIRLAAAAQGMHDHVAEGEAKEEAGYLDAALTEYRKGLPLAAAMNGLASIEIANGTYDSVLFRLAASRAIDDSSENLIKNYQVEAKYWQAQNQYDQALTFLKQALDLAVKTNALRSQATILSHMGGIYFSHDPDMNIARGFYEKSNEDCDSLVDASLIAQNYTRIANTYLVDGNSAKASDYLDHARKIADKSGNPLLQAYVLSSLAVILYDEGRYKECIDAMQEPIRITRELGQARQLQNYLLNISEMYMMIKDYGNATKALDEGLSVSRGLKDIVYMKYFYERASALDSAQGNYKGAYANLRLSMLYKDSTFSAQQLRDVKDIQQKYEAEQKEKIIAEREAALALTIGIAIITILLLLLVLIVVRARNRRQANQLQLETIVKTQEDVQQRIARDLHDGLVQVLGAAKMSLQAVGPASDREAIQKQIHSASEILDEAVKETRTISHQVLPYLLLKNGLVPALEDLFTRSLASFNFEYDPIKLNEERSINMYRIAQELVNNVQKHAPSSHVIVDLEQGVNEITLLFSDNGPGFDVSAGSPGAGLINIDTRARLMKGISLINSAVGKGTTIEIIIPV